MTSTIPRLKISLDHGAGLNQPEVLVLYRIAHILVTEDAAEVQVAPRGVLPCVGRVPT